MRSLLVVAFLTATAGAAFAQNVGDAAAGHELAAAVCAECHAVEAGGGTSPNINAPTFQDVADTVGVSELALTVFFQTPHSTMPNLIIPADDQRDLAAYILSLKQ